MASDDGGPAFPFTPNQQLKLPDGTWDQDTEFGDPGMSLRDYFAGQALAHPYTQYKPGMVKREDSTSDAAQRAYWMADAMITTKRRREAEEAKVNG